MSDAALSAQSGYAPSGAWADAVVIGTFLTYSCCVVGVQGFSAAAVTLQSMGMGAALAGTSAA